MNSAFPTELPRAAATTGGLTSRRTIAVAVLTIAAVVASTYAAAGIADLLAGNNLTFQHVLWHLLWGLLTLAIALGIRLLRRAWPAPAPHPLSTVLVSGEKQYQLLALAQWLALAVAAGQFLASVGANFIDARSLNAPPHEDYFAIVHAAGEVLSVVSWGMLMLVSLHMLGVGVRGALRPRAHPGGGAIN